MASSTPAIESGHRGNFCFTHEQVLEHERRWAERERSERAAREQVRLSDIDYCRSQSSSDHAMLSGWATLSDFVDDQSLLTTLTVRKTGYLTPIPPSVRTLSIALISIDGNDLETIIGHTLDSLTVHDYVWRQLTLSPALTKALIINGVRCEELSFTESEDSAIETLTISNSRKLKTIDRLPAGLRVLTLTRMHSLRDLPPLPHSLEELHVEDCHNLRLRTYAPILRVLKSDRFPWINKKQVRTVEDYHEAFAGQY